MKRETREPVQKWFYPVMNMNNGATCSLFDSLPVSVFGLERLFIAEGRLFDFGCQFVLGPVY